MVDQKTLEELRAKIMASMGDKTESTSAQKRADPRRGGTFDSAKRAKLGVESSNRNIVPQQQGLSFPAGPGRGCTNSFNPRNNRDHHQNDNYRRYNNDNSNGRYRTRYRNDNTRQKYRNYNNTNNNYAKNYNNNWNRNNNQQTTHENKYTKPVVNAFQKVHLYKNLTTSKLNSTIIINNIQLKEEGAEIKSKNLIDSFCKGQDLNFEMTSFNYNKSLNHIVVEFNSAECVTRILACRSFFNKRFGLLDAQWERPYGYVLQTDNLTKICNNYTIALEEISLENIDGDTVKDKILKLLEKKGITLKANNIIPLEYKENENQNVFTGCILLVSPTEIDGVEEKFDDLKWFKPNESKILRQETKSLIFGNISKKVVEIAIPESKVLLLLNCVNPLDLTTDKSLADDIQQCLLDTLSNVESVKVIKPNADYKLTFDSLKEQAGNIYVKFQDIDSAKLAIKELSKHQFNGRKILSAYINEDDFTNILENK